MNKNLIYYKNKKYVTLDRTPKVGQEVLIRKEVSKGVTLRKKSIVTVRYVSKEESKVIVVDRRNIEFLTSLKNCISLVDLDEYLLELNHKYGVDTEEYIQAVSEIKGYSYRIAKIAKETISEHSEALRRLAEVEKKELEVNPNEKIEVKLREGIQHYQEKVKINILYQDNLETYELYCYLNEVDNLESIYEQLQKKKEDIYSITLSDYYTSIKLTLFYSKEKETILSDIHIETTNEERIDTERTYSVNNYSHKRFPFFIK